LYFVFKVHDWSIVIAANVKALAMGPEFIVASAWLPMPDKDMFQVKISSPIGFLLPNYFAQWQPF
jgi:hypothetical protein